VLTPRLTSVMKNSDDVLLVHVERPSFVASLSNAERWQSSELRIIAGAIAAYDFSVFPLCQSFSCLASPCTAPPPSSIASLFHPSSWRLWLRQHTLKKETYFSYGMCSSDNRRAILQCFEAFKACLVYLLSF